jgi:hypothetical protein
MIRDSRLTFSQTTSPLALNTGAAGTYVIGDTIDLTTTGRDIGAGEGIGDLFLVIMMATTAAGAGASAQFNLITSDSPSMTAPVVITGTQAFPVASLVAGYQALAIRLPAAVYKRYLGLQQVTSGAAFTAGSVYAFFAEDVNAIRFYPQAFS